MHITWHHYKIDSYQHWKNFPDLTLLNLIGLPTIHYYDVVKIEKVKSLFTKSINNQKYLCIGIYDNHIELLIEESSGELLIQNEDQFEFINTNFELFVQCFISYISMIDKSTYLDTPDEIHLLLDIFLRTVYDIDNQIEFRKNSFWVNNIQDMKSYI